VQDVVERLRELSPGVSGKKLQKLLYYAQAWSLVWDGQSLFADDFEAWREGPVVRCVYEDERYGTHAQRLGDANALTRSQRETIDAVAGLYGSKSADWLSRLTHREAPWRTARAGLAPTEKSQNKISRVEMAAFYSGSSWGQGKAFSPDFIRGLELLVSLPEDEVAELGVRVPTPVDEHLRWLDTGEEP
jgi:uncharacterized phage-associated protein